jgi:hypothetical protein
MQGQSHQNAHRPLFSFANVDGGNWFRQLSAWPPRSTRPNPRQQLGSVRPADAEIDREIRFGLSFDSKSGVTTMMLENIIKNSA